LRASARAVTAVLDAAFRRLGMSDELNFTVGELAVACGGELVDPARQAGKVIRTVATLEEADAESITWIVEARHAKALLSCHAAAVIGTKALLGGDPRGVVVADAELAIAQVLDRFFIAPERPASGIHPSAVVHQAVRLGGGVRVGAFAVVHREATIGDNTIIHEGVSIGRGVRIGRDGEIFDRCVVYDHCRIGDRVTIHAGAVIGADGFGYIFRDGRHRKLAHIGTVIIEDDVEIGANTTIDRAKVGATIIGHGSKIDNLVMIAHNARVGPLCVIAGQAALAGSVRLGAGVALGGRAGVSHGLRLGDGVRAALGALAIGDIPAGQVIMGYPAKERMMFLREQARLAKLPKLVEEVAELRSRVKQLEAAANHRESDGS
jgi:UDP-3-O-[3-hydroxymyristoyl] glucosamine N-acyltransferase